VDCGQLIKAFVARVPDSFGSSSSSSSSATRLRDALAVLQLMEDQGIMAQAGHCFSMLFTACGEQGEVGVGRRLHALLLSGKVGLDNVTVAGLIGMYGKCGRLEDAIAVYDALAKDRGRQPDVGVINALVHASRQCGQPGRALPLLDDMQRFRIAPDELCFHQLAAACAEAGDATAAKRMVEWMREGRLGFKASGTDCGQLVKALVARIIGPESGLKDSSSSSSSSSGGATRLTDALAVLQLMEDQGTMADAGHCFSMLFAACGEQGEVDVGRRLHALLLSDSQVSLDNFLAAGLISMYGKCGHIDDAVAVYSAYTSGGRRHDVAVVNALVHACRQCGQPGRALSLLDDIVRFHVTPNELCFHQLAAACAEAGDAVAAKRLLGWLREGRLGFHANSTDCGQLIKAFVARIDPEPPEGSTGLADALAVLQVAEDQGTAVGSHCYSMLFAACGEQAEVDVGRRLHARLLASSKEGLDDFTAAGLISMYAKCGYPDEAAASMEAKQHQSLVAPQRGKGRSLWCRVEQQVRGIRWWPRWGSTDAARRRWPCSSEWQVGRRGRRGPTV
jgi:pentatricopeptide repeat protein